MFSEKIKNYNQAMSGLKPQEKGTMVEPNKDSTPVTEKQQNLPIDVDSLSDKKIGQTVEKPHLDGKTATISKVELSATGDIRTSKDGTKKQETILCKVYYQIDGAKEDAYENYGGVSRFVREDGSKSEPTIWTDGKNAAAKLFKKWLLKVNKNAEDVSLKEFFKGLQGMKVMLKEEQVAYQGDISYKNIVEIFL